MPRTGVRLQFIDFIVVRVLTSTSWLCSALFQSVKVRDSARSGFRSENLRAQIPHIPDRRYSILTRVPNVPVVKNVQTLTAVQGSMFNGLKADARSKR